MDAEDADGAGGGGAGRGRAVCGVHGADVAGAAGQGTEGGVFVVFKKERAFAAGVAAGGDGEGGAADRIDRDRSIAGVSGGTGCDEQWGAGEAGFGAAFAFCRGSGGAGG